MKFLQETQMLLTGTLGIIMRFAYTKRKDPNISRGSMAVYFIISFGLLTLLILFLRKREILWGMDLDDGTKMILTAIASVFAEKFFTFLIDREESLFAGAVKKTTGIDLKKKDDGTSV